jgi:predicted PurR-regulated permease PerM
LTENQKRQSKSRRTASDDFSKFASRAVFVAALIVSGFLAWELRSVLILTFAGVLLAIGLRALARPFVHWTRLGTSAAVSVVALLALAVISGTAFVIGNELSSQLAALWTHLPELINQAEQSFEQSALGKAVVQVLGSLPEASSPVSVTSALSAATATFGFLVDVLIILVLGLFFAYMPRLYMNGVIALVPAAQKSLAREVLSSTGQALRSWLLGQFISMVVIGVISGIGLWFLDIPLAFGLGFLAFILEFVPIVGPLAAAVPAVLVGLSKAPIFGFWVILLYVGIHVIEGYIVVPMLQRWAVHIPPALTIISVVTFGLIFGWLGVLLATPLMVATIVWVKMIYVESTLKTTI